MASAAVRNRTICAGTPDELADKSWTRLADALVRAGAQDREAFREVYVLTSARLFGTCLLICEERSAAEDILRTIYLEVWRQAGAWEPARENAITWLATIAGRHAIAWKRKQQLGRVASISDAPALHQLARSAVGGSAGFDNGIDEPSAQPRPARPVTEARPVDNAPA